MSPVADLTAHRLRWRLATAQAHGQVPSVVAGIVRDGALAWSDGVGDVPGTVTDTQYRIGSITKTLTAVLVLQLVDEGRSRLDAPASVVLGDVGYADRTIRQLLAHSGGLQTEPAGRGGSDPRAAPSTSSRPPTTGRRPPTAGPAVPLLQPRLRAARRGRRPAA